jgi:hypothetical protein
MQRHRIPVLLEEYKALARKKGLPEPNSECKAGWCLQCQCPKALMQELFGDVEYIVEPSMPPFAGSMLPCISRRSVPTFNLVEMYTLVKSFAPQQIGHIFRKEPVFARLFSDSEIGSLHRSKTNSGVEIKAVQITTEHILVKQRLDLPPGVGEAVVDASVFKARYVTQPTHEFLPYSDKNGVEAVLLTHDIIQDLSTNDGPIYVKYNREVMSVIAGDVVTNVGVLIRKEMLGKEFMLKLETEPEIINSQNLQELKL